MKTIIEYLSTSALGMCKIFTVATVSISLLACTNSPTGENCCRERGNQFLVEQKVNNVYQAPPKPGEKLQDPPIFAGDEYKIVKKSRKSNTFKFVAGERFRGEREAWEGLELEYQPGSDANLPVPLIAEVCSNNNTCGQTQQNTLSRYNKYGFIPANVQNDFINLQGRGLEFLEGGPIKFNGKLHIVHIFHIKKIGSKDVRLLIFYCNVDHCNHKGMVD